VIHVFSSKTGQSTGQTFHNGKIVEALAASPAGDLLAVGGNNHRLTLWDVRSGEVVLHRDDFSSASALPCFTPDSQSIVFPDQKGNLIVLDLQTGGEQSAPLGHSADHFVCQFESEGRRLLTSGTQRRVCLWELGNGVHKLATLPHPLISDSLAYDNRRKCFVTSTFQGSLSFWDGQTGATVSATSTLPRPFGQMLLAANGRRALAFAGNGTARVFDVETRLAIGPTLPHLGRPLCGAISRDGGTVMTVDKPSAVCIWRIPPPVVASGEVVGFWVEAVTGRALDADGIARQLTATEWRESRRRAGPLLPGG
jgi:WD40 repeat protein